MNDIRNYDDIPIGMEMGPLEITIDDAYLDERMVNIQWENKASLESQRFAPPGITIVNHAKMKFMALPNMKASIWAKSEHEFIKPIKLGSKVKIRGKVIEKFEKRGRNYLISEYETVDENGEVLLRSRETGLYVE